MPPTLLVSAIGQISDVRRAVTLDPKEPGEILYLLGATRNETGGSEYFRWRGQRAGQRAPLGQPAPFVGNAVPRLDPVAQLPLYQAFQSAIAAGQVRAAAVLAKGGLGLALARMAMAAELGLEVELPPGELAADVMLFSETGGRFLASVAEKDASAFEDQLRSLPVWRIGRVTKEPRLVVKAVADVDVASLKRAYQRTLGEP